MPEDVLNKEFDEIPWDPTREVLLLQKLGFPNSWLPLLLTPGGISVRNEAAGLTPSRTAVGSRAGTPLLVHVPFLPLFWHLGLF